MTIQQLVLDGHPAAAVAGHEDQLCLRLVVRVVQIRAETPAGSANPQSEPLLGELPSL